MKHCCVSSCLRLGFFSRNWTTSVFRTITCQEHATRGLCNVKFLIVGMMSGRCISANCFYIQKEWVSLFHVGKCWEQGSVFRSGQVGVHSVQIKSSGLKLCKSCSRCDVTYIAIIIQVALLSPYLCIHSVSVVFHSLQSCHTYILTKDTNAFA